MAHAVVTEKQITETLAVLSRMNETLPKDDNNREYFNDCGKAGLNALSLANGDLEYLTYLYDAAIKWVNQIAFILFRQELLTDELTTEFRKLETPESTTEKVKAYMEEDKETVDKINGEQAVYNNHVKRLDLFKAVIGGMSLEEAQAKQAEYEAKIAAAQQTQPQGA